MERFTLDEINTELRKRIFDEKETVELVLNSQDLPDEIDRMIASAEDKELELSPIVLGESNLLHTAYHSLDLRSGRWLRLWMRTYLEKGRVYFSRDSGEGTCIARLTF